MSSTLLKLKQVGDLEASSETTFRLVLQITVDSSNEKGTKALRSKDVVVGIDHSDSMTEWILDRNGKPIFLYSEGEKNYYQGYSRLEKAVNAISAVIDSAVDPTDKMAIVKFNESAEVVQHLLPVSDKFLLKQMLNEITTDGSTDIENCLSTALAQFPETTDSDRARFIILLTDGDHCNGAHGERAFTTEKIKRIGEEAIRKNCRIYCIGIDREINADLLKEIAQYSNGSFWGGFDGEHYEKELVRSLVQCSIQSTSCVSRDTVLSISTLPFLQLNNSSDTALFNFPTSSPVSSVDGNRIVNIKTGEVQNDFSLSLEFQVNQEQFQRWKSQKLQRGASGTIGSDKDLIHLSLSYCNLSTRKQENISQSVALPPSLLDLSEDQYHYQEFSVDENTEDQTILEEKVIDIPDDLEGFTNNEYLDRYISLINGERNILIHPRSIINIKKTPSLIQKSAADDHVMRSEKGIHSMTQRKGKSLVIGSLSLDDASGGNDGPAVVLGASRASSEFKALQSVFMEKADDSASDQTKVSCFGGNPVKYGHLKQEQELPPYSEMGHDSRSSRFSAPATCRKGTLENWFSNPFIRNTILQSKEGNRRAVINSLSKIIHCIKVEGEHHSTCQEEILRITKLLHDSVVHQIRKILKTMKDGVNIPPKYATIIESSVSLEQSVKDLKKYFENSLRNPHVIEGLVNPHKRLGDNDLKRMKKEEAKIKIYNVSQSLEKQYSINGDKTDGNAHENHSLSRLFASKRQNELFKDIIDRITGNAADEVAESLKPEVGKLSPDVIQAFLKDASGTPEKAPVDVGKISPEKVQFLAKDTSSPETKLEKTNDAQVMIKQLMEADEESKQGTRRQSIKDKVRLMNDQLKNGTFFSNGKKEKN